jgi:hypothetical protein
MFHCSGAIQARETPCPSAHHVDQPLPVLVPEIVPIDVRNPAAVDDTLNYWVTVSASHAGGAFPAIRLDGGAPGQIVTGSTVIPAGGMRTIPVNVEFLEHYPVQFFDLELVGESPDGGFKDELASTGLRSTAGAEILAVDVPAVPYVATSAEAAIGGIRPNPSASATTISFRLARRGAVDLAVFDVRGARVARLLNEERAAGDYSVRWDGAREDATPLPSGVYFVVLRVAGRIGDTSRFVLVR